MYDDPTEQIPAIPDPHGLPTQQVVSIPGYLWADQEEEEESRETVHSMQEPRDPVIAWPPFLVFLAVFAFYAAALWFGVVHANEVLYVLLIEWQW